MAAGKRFRRTAPWTQPAAETPRKRGQGIAGTAAAAPAGAALAACLYGCTVRQDRLPAARGPALGEHGAGAGGAWLGQPPGRQAQQCAAARPCKGSGASGNQAQLPLLRYSSCPSCLPRLCCTSKEWKQGSQQGRRWSAGLGCSGTTACQRVTAPCKVATRQTIQLLRRGSGNLLAPDCGSAVEQVNTRWLKGAAGGRLAQGCQLILQTPQLCPSGFFVQHVIDEGIGV